MMSEGGTLEHREASIVYDLAMDRHRERVARGVVAQSLTLPPPVSPIRALLAGAITALAARLDPTCRPAERPMVVHAPT